MSETAAFAIALVVALVYDWPWWAWATFAVLLAISVLAELGDS